jgi:hypothetical protein
MRLQEENIDGIDSKNHRCMENGKFLDFHLGVFEAFSPMGC